MSFRFTVAPLFHGNSNVRFSEKISFCYKGKVSIVSTRPKHVELRAVTGENAGEESKPGLDIIAARITPVIDKFFASDAEGDPDKPEEGFSPVTDAIDAIAEGKYAIVVDGKNVGYFVMAASLVTPEAVQFIVTHGTGLVCCPMGGKELDRLRIPLMVPDADENQTPFTFTLDAKVGTSTGVSATDRANTILALSSPDSKPESFRRPGHVFPLRSHEKGVLARPGFTEAAVDLVTVCGLVPVAVCSHVVDSTGELPQDLSSLFELAKKHNLPVVSIPDLERYMKKREKLVERTAVARLPTKWGDFQVYSYKSKLNATEHLALVKGEIGEGMDVLVRVHSECVTGDILGSVRCDCGKNLEVAMESIEKAGRGVVVYLRGNEGMRLGLGYKLSMYNMEDKGNNSLLQNQPDSRNYGIGAQILRDIGVRTMKLMTNNSGKYLGLRGYGLAVTSRILIKEHSKFNY